MGINIFGVYESISQVYFALILYCDSPEQRTVRQKNKVRVDTHERHKHTFLIPEKRHQVSFLTGNAHPVVVIEQPYKLSMKSCDNGLFTKSAYF